MKIRIELTDGGQEDEVVIRCARVTDTIDRICDLIAGQTNVSPKLTFYQGNREFYLPLGDLLFFETEGEHVFAHTAADTYRIKLRLYELEALLPMQFIRASKSAIVNTDQIYSITRNLAASSLVQFTGSHKQLYVSRNYYDALRQRLNERR